MSTDLMVLIVKAAGGYEQAVRDLQLAGFCLSKAMKAAWAYYGETTR